MTVEDTRIDARQPGEAPPSPQDIDDELDPTADLEDFDPRPETPLDQIKQELSKEVENDDTDPLPVMARPGYAATFTTTIPYDRLEKLQKGCRNRQALGGFDELKLALVILANFNTAIYRGEEKVSNGDKPLNFRAKRFVEDIMETDRPVAAVQKFYGKDGHVIATAREVTRAAGYGDDLADLAPDPTEAPSRA